MSELTDRIEEAIEGVISTALPTAQVLTYGGAVPADKSYILIRSLQGDEDPPGSGIFGCDTSIIMHGNFSEDDVGIIEDIFYAGYDFAETLRTAGAGAYKMPQGLAVDLNTGGKSAEGLDADREYSFVMYAQKDPVPAVT